MASKKRSAPRATSDDPGLEKLLAKADAVTEQWAVEAEAFYAQQERREAAETEMARRAQQSPDTEV